MVDKKYQTCYNERVRVYFKQRRMIMEKKLSEKGKELMKEVAKTKGEISEIIAECEKEKSEY